MKTCKRMVIFLLLGVLLVGLLLSGCAPESTEPTDHVFTLDRSLIEGCTYAGITRSMFDSQMHMLLGEKNVITFFDTFFAGLVLTDNGARIKQVQANSDQSGFPFQICFTRNENTSLLVCFYENGAITVNYENHDFASVQDNIVDKQAIEQWLKEHDAL